MKNAVVTIRIFLDCLVWIEKSVPWVTVWHHGALPSDANSDPKGQTFLSMPNSHDRSFFFHTFQLYLLLISFKCSKLTSVVK